VEHLDAGFHALGLAVGRVVAEDDGGGIEQGDERVADDFFLQRTEIIEAPILAQDGFGLLHAMRRYGGKFKGFEIRDSKI